jgi:hypothetical protein
MASKGETLSEVIDPMLPRKASKYVQNYPYPKPTLVDR